VSNLSTDASDPDTGMRQGMVGAFTKRAAIVCGGGINSENISKECFEYIPAKDR
jgi:hypothetical protein